MRHDVSSKRVEVQVEVETSIGRIDETLDPPAAEVFADALAPALRQIADAFVALAAAPAVGSWCRSPSPNCSP